MSSSSCFGPTECKCGLPLMTLISWTRDNPARRFGVCPNKYQVMEELKKSQMNACFWKSTAIVFGIVALFISPLSKSLPRESERHLLILVTMTKVIKEEFEKLESLKISDDSFTCNTSLEIFYKEFNQMSRMDDDLFTYEVEIPGLASVPCDLNEEDDLEQ
ncbi:hypothetical protein Tco_0620414 [Tanacetum coccineum]